MRRIMFLMLVTGILVSANGQNDNQTGMLFGENFVFYMTAPSGWVLDNQSGVNQGQHMVFYPQGGSWKNSPVVAYGNSTPLTDTVKSVGDFVKQTVQGFRQGGSFSIKSRKQKTIPLAEGKKADIYYYTGDQWANYEAVGYILEKKTINFLVYTARNKPAFEANLEKFFEILRSYKNAFREDADDYGEESFNALKAKAEENKSTIQGKEYEDLLTETQTRNIFERFRQCLTYQDPKEDIPKIGFIFIIGEDGTVEDSYAWPVTPLSLCVKGLIAGSKMPAHKLGKFYWHVFLDITVEDRIENIIYKGSSRDKLSTGAPGDPAEFLKIGSLSPNRFSAQGFINAYEYWASFKPGSFVTYKIASTREGTTSFSYKTFSVKEVTPQKAVIEVRESSAEEEARLKGGGPGRTADFSFAVWTDTPPWEREDLYHGFLSLDILNLLKTLRWAVAVSDADEVEIKGLPIKTQRVKFLPDGLDANTVTVTFWYAEDIPGGIARFRKEVGVHVPFQEEILVEDFRADRREIADYRELAQKPGPQMKASTYLGRNLRFFREAQLVEDGLVSLQEYKRNYDVFTERVGILLEKAWEWKDHFEEDLKDIESQLPEKERQKLEPFLEQAAEYCAALLDFLKTYERNLRKLQIMTNIPESFWSSVKDKMDEIRASKSQSFRKYVTARNELKSIEITLAR
jgi:hypothetical protein